MTAGVIVGPGCEVEPCPCHATGSEKLQAACACWTLPSDLVSSSSNQREPGDGQKGGEQ